jgi:hypothetical protein
LCTSPVANLVSGSQLKEVLDFVQGFPERRTPWLMPEKMSLASTYSAEMIWAQSELSPWNNFQINFSMRAVFIFLELIIPRPPPSFGMHTSDQLTK